MSQSCHEPACLISERLYVLRRKFRNDQQADLRARLVVTRPGLVTRPEIGGSSISKLRATSGLYGALIRLLRLIGAREADEK